MKRVTTNTYCDICEKEIVSDDNEEVCSFSMVGEHWGKLPKNHDPEDREYPTDNFTEEYDEVCWKCIKKIYDVAMPVLEKLRKKKK
jgi:hypothetical protein